MKHRSCYAVVSVDDNASTYQLFIFVVWHNSFPKVYWAVDDRLFLLSFKYTCNSSNSDQHVDIINNWLISVHTM